MYFGMVARLRKSLLRISQKRERMFYQEARESFTQAGALVNVSDLIRIAASRYAHLPALITKEKTITYRELYARSLQVAKILAHHKVHFHDRVLLYCENSIEFYIFYYAIWLRGAVVVPVNIFLHEKEFAHVIKDSEPAAILTTCKLKEKLHEVVAKKFCTCLPQIFTEKDINWSEPVANLDDPFEANCLDLDELCLLLYTSGTTGVPKGVMLSSRNIVTNSIQNYARLRTFSAQKERFFAVLPLFHVFAQNTCMWLPLMTGSSVIIVARLDRQLILDGLAKKPTLFFGFPALYGLLCLMKTAPLGTIKRFVSGADALPDKIRSAFAMIYGRKICAGYGLTEASPVIAINHDREHAPTDVVGRPLVGIECDIRDEHEKSLGRGKIGTLWVRGDNVMLGYYKAPEITAGVLRQGWLNTGDLASMEEDGMLAIRGRSKDLIIHKGFNIYPQEVENILMTHPAVFKAAVVGRFEAVAGQVPIAFIATKENKELVEKSLRALCQDNLASYKIPRKFICLDDLPMSPTGKVDKKRLQQMYS